MPGNAPTERVFGGNPPWPDDVDELTEGETYALELEVPVFDPDTDEESTQRDWSASVEEVKEDERGEVVTVITGKAGGDN